MIRAIVTDIEGTTSSLSFVKDVLFPYAYERMSAFVQQHGHEPAVRELLQQVSEVAGLSMSDEQAISQLRQWIDEDRKVTPLKALQGLIWEAGYRNGDFTGHIYADVFEQLKRWHQNGIRLYVYSSGSVHAQKLLFGHTDSGDLTPLFSGYFDTHIGLKQNSDSYRAIVTEINKDIKVWPDEILFLSDIEAELDAAADAGLQTCWLVRDSEPDKQARHRQVTQFGQVTSLS